MPMLRGRRVALPGYGHLSSPADRPTEAARLGEVQFVPRGGQVVAVVTDGRDAVFGVLSGTLRSCRYAADGRRQITAFLFPGDWFRPEERLGHPTLVEAVTTAQVVRLTQRRLASAGPDGTSAMQEILDANLTAAEDRIIVLGQKSARDKLAAFLLGMSDRLAEGGAEIRLPMSRYDIADYLGLRSETVCRTLSQLVAAGVIALPEPQLVRLLKPAELQDMLT
jgi:CRP-like cAMP-binding protein